MLLHLSLFVKLHVTFIAGKFWPRLGHDFIFLIDSEGVGGGPAPHIHVCLALALFVGAWWAAEQKVIMSWNPC